MVKKYRQKKHQKEQEKSQPQSSSSARQQHFTTTSTETKDPILDMGVNKKDGMTEMEYELFMKERVRSMLEKAENVDNTTKKMHYTAAAAYSLWQVSDEATDSKKADDFQEQSDHLWSKVLQLATKTNNLKIQLRCVTYVNDGSYGNRSCGYGVV